MAKFSFTDEDLQKASESKIFNGGKPGVAKDLRVFVEEAGKDGVPENTNPNAPDFRLVFEDPNGSRINKALFPIKEEEYPNMYNVTYEDAIRKEWAYLNKVVEHSGGTKVMDFENDTDLYSKVKTAIGVEKVNLFAAYGTTRSPKEYLEPRKFLPAVEPANTPDSESKLQPTRLDNMERPAPSTEEEVKDSFFG